MNAFVRTLPILFLSSLAACSGGGITAPSIPNRTQPSQASAKTAQAAISIVVPLRGRTTVAKRTRDYVSPNTESFGITPTSNNGTAIASPQTQVVNVTPTSPDCTQSSTALTCTAVVSLPVGNDVLSVTANSGTNLGGATLSQNQSVDTTISPTIANTVSFTMNAVATAVIVTTSTINGNLSTQPAPGSATTIPVTVTAIDCTGATIVGPGAYVDPIGLTLTEAPSANATSLSETTVNSPSDNVTLTWNGSSATQYSSIAPLVPNYAGGCGNQYGPGGLQTGYFLPHPEPPYLWTAQISNSGATGEYGWLIGYPLSWIHAGSGGSMRPGVTIESPGIGFLEASVDHAGNVYTFNQDSSGSSDDANAYKYAPGATFTAAPETTIAASVLQPPNGNTQNPASVESLVSDPNGTLFEGIGEFLNNMGNNNTGLIQTIAPQYGASSVLYNNANKMPAWPYGANGPNSAFVDSNDNYIASFEQSTNYIGVFGNGGWSYAYPSGSPAIGGVWSDGTTLYASTGGNNAIDIISYGIAGLGSASTERTVFSTATPVGLPQFQSFVRDGAGYYYLEDGISVHVYPPTASGTGVAASLTFTNGADPTTTSGQMVVPSGVVPPANGINSIATQI